MVAATLASAAVAPAWADETAENREQAWRLRDAGAGAMAQGDFAAALELFHQAFRLYPSPNARYNVGVALDRLGRSGEAVEAFEAFLAESPNAPNEAREFAQQRLKELVPRISRLTFAVSPPEAAVALDGLPLSLPRARELPVMPGVHEVTAELTGYVSTSARIVVTAGEQRRIDVALQPIVVTEPILPPAAVPSRPPIIANATTPPERKRRWLIPVVITGAAAVVGLAVGLGVGLGSSTRYPNTTFGELMPR
jgi:hypothetical protein